MDIFLGAFLILSLLCAVLYKRTNTPICSDPLFGKFKTSYLCVYLLATASDWLQGPYVYALYDSYGISTHNIERLFVAGYGSSMLFGTVVGSIGDKYGRRTNCILFAFLYSFACFTKHFNNLHILLVGRLVSGISTSILCSNFESWLVCEHHKRGHDAQLLSGIFSQAVFGNSLVAILAGIIAQLLADLFGYTAPFDMAIFLLVIMVTSIMFLWDENYGDPTANITRSFQSANVAIRSDCKVFCLGMIQSLFEGSMYTFVLEWTPALTPSENPYEPVVELRDHNLHHTLGVSTDENEDSGLHESIPHGIIFAAFMVAIMAGSSIFRILSASHQPESFLRFVLLIASSSLTIPILFHGNQLLVFIAFLVFEVCVGIFWPSLSVMRSKYIPESSRSTVMNLFRVPLNFIVIVILTQNFSMTVIFQCCVVFLLIACACQHWLYRLAALPSTTTHS